MNVKRMRMLGTSLIGLAVVAAGFVAMTPANAATCSKGPTASLSAPGGRLVGHGTATCGGYSSGQEGRLTVTVYHIYSLLPDALVVRNSQTKTGSAIRTFDVTAQRCDNRTSADYYTDSVTSNPTLSNSSGSAHFTTCAGTN